MSFVFNFLKFAAINFRRKMKKDEVIEHEAIVKEVNEKAIIVNVLAKSACISCQLKKVCSISDFKEKSVEVLKEDNKVKPGDKVIVYLSQDLGLKAVFLGYVLPFIIVVLTLIIFLEFTGNELASGLISLTVLIPYYLFVYLFRHKIRKRYKFKLK